MHSDTWVVSTRWRAGLRGRTPQTVFEGLRPTQLEAEQFRDALVAEHAAAGFLPTDCETRVDEGVASSSPEPARA